MIPESRPSNPVAAINHELRTPLNAILGFSSLLADAEGLDERHRRYAAHILVSGRRLLGLVDEILALVRSSGQAPLPRPVVRVAEIGDEAARRGCSGR